MSTATNNIDRSTNVISCDQWDEDNGPNTLEMEVEIPYGVRMLEDTDGKRLVDHFPTYQALQAFSPAKFKCKDRKLVRLSLWFCVPILEIKKAIAQYEVEMSYWRYYFSRDGAKFASAEDDENKERLYRVLTSDNEYEPGDTVYMNFFY